VIRRLLRGVAASLRTAWWALWHDDDLQHVERRRMHALLERYGVDQPRVVESAQEENGKRWRMAEELARTSIFDPATCKWLIDEYDGDFVAADWVIAYAYRHRVSLDVAMRAQQRRVRS